ncbi:hypothetical protein BDW66DRAFT_151542 [Aspergillus desertorum]
MPSPISPASSSLAPTVTSLLYMRQHTPSQTGTETIAKAAHPSLSDAITFVCTFLVNVPLGVWKDICFAQFSKGPNQASPISTAAGTVPVRKKTGSTAATATLLVRDAVTIHGSFTLAQQCADMIPDSLAAQPYAKTVFTQLIVPVLSQLVATPLHLLGLDLYNRQYRVPWADRRRVVWRNLGAATAIRCARIVPAFGIGCLVNMGLRGFLHELE